jgi:hypothetical protein
MRKRKSVQVVPAVFTTAFIAVCLAASPLRSQVLIGDKNAPQSFSVLELISDDTRGMRLPQFTQAERDALEASVDFINEKTGKAMGLQIFNLDTRCVETWNGKRWIAECADCDEINFPYIGNAYSLCTGSTVADLTAAAGAYVSWFNAPVDGTEYSPTAALTNGATYYAEQGFGHCKVAGPRKAVIVTLGSCSTPPTAGLITTFINVMYDFQHQTLEAYNSNGIATDFQWQIAKSNSTFNDIPGAPNAKFFTIPSFFSKTYDNAYNVYSDTLWFRCRLSNEQGNINTASFEMIFINTTAADNTTYLPSYGELNGVKYIELNIGDGVNDVQGGSVATLKVALLSLGQSADWDGNSQTVTKVPPVYIPNNDAADLGDYYQWGRVADGHQRTVWSKAANHINQILPYGNAIYETADTASYLIGGPNYADYYDNYSPNNSTPFYQVKPDDFHYGKFIKLGANGYWYNIDNSLSPQYSYHWGQTTQSPTPPNRTPAKNGNDPCPAGWKVPSRWQWLDTHSGNASALDYLYIMDNIWPAAVNNNWGTNLRGGVNGGIGGAIVVNKIGARLLIPATGYRSDQNGVLTDQQTRGYYWSSSTHNYNHQYRGVLNFLFGNNPPNGGLYPGTHNSQGTHGLVVRCVCE